MSNGDASGRDGSILENLLWAPSFAAVFAVEGREVGCYRRMFVRMRGEFSIEKMWNI